MGYYTRFEFAITPNELQQPIIDTLQDRTGYDFDDTCKWYDCERDIARISAEYPEAWIEVTGYGEEAGDLWRLYATNGETEHVKCLITFPPATLVRMALHPTTVMVQVFDQIIPVVVDTWEGDTPEAQRQRVLFKLRRALTDADAEVQP